MKIYDKNGIELIDINVSDESYRQREIMASPALTLYFELNAFVELPVGAYCDFEGERFYLFDTANFTKNSSKAYSYTLILHGIQEKLSRFRFYDYANGGLIFSLTAKPLVHIEMLVNVLNAKDGGWTVGTVTDASELVLSYSHNSCLEALAMICDESELEYEITSGKVINLRKTEYNKATPLALEYGPGNGLKPGIERKNDNTGRPIERLFVQGGDRNIDLSKYGSRYLLLPKSQELGYDGHTYGTDATGQYIQRTDKAIETGQEGSLDASSIYPSRVGVVTDVEVEDADKNLYNLLDTTIPEALNFEDYLIAGETMTVVFQSGMLTGKEFEVKYVHEFRRFELVPKDIDGFTMPSETFTPAIGDTFVVFGCSFPDAYVSDDATKTGASWDMFREAVSYLYENEVSKYSYGGTVSPIWLKDNEATALAKLIPGGYCSLTDPELGGVLIRVRSIKDFVNNPYDVTIDLSNALVKPSIVTQLAKLNSYTASLAVQRISETIAAAAAAGQNITNLTEIINSFYPSFSDLSGSPLDNAALAEYLNQIGLGAYVDTSSKIISGNVIPKEGLTFESTDFVYKILGVPYLALSAGNYTLADADPNYGRFDLFYLDMFSNLNIRTGVASAAPTVPVVSSTELLVRQVFIPAGALEPADINIERIYDEMAVTEWSPTAFAEAGKTVVTLDADADPYNGDKHIQVDIAVPDEVVSTPLHYVGESYQGGIIFYIDPTSGGKKGLIAAVEDVAYAFWSRLSGYSDYSTWGRDTAIGTGQANTAAMLATAPSAGQIIKTVDSYSKDGYSDWFLPSRDELYLLWQRRFDVGGFNSSGSYWSSSETAWDKAYCVDWWNGKKASVKKNNERYGRPIRAFDDTTIPTSAPVEAYTPQDTSVVFEAGEDVPVNLGVISMKVKTSAAWRANSILLLEIYKGAVRTGSCALSPATNLFAFKPANNDDYQLVAIDLFNFAPTHDVFDAFKISLAGSWPNNLSLLIDDARFQYTDVVKDNDTIVQVPALALLAASWVEVSGLWQYELLNARIKATSIVDIIPANEAADVVNEAGIYPETISSEGKVYIFAANQPTADIPITITIMEASV